MDLGDMIGPEAVIPSLKAKSKKMVLQDLAQKASSLTGVKVADIFETLLTRERLGSTGVGHGIAIPHGRLAPAPGRKGPGPGFRLAPLLEGLVSDFSHGLNLRPEAYGLSLNVRLAQISERTN